MTKLTRSDLKLGVAYGGDSIRDVIAVGDRIRFLHTGKALLVGEDISAHEASKRNGVIFLCLANGVKAND